MALTARVTTFTRELRRCERIAIVLSVLLAGLAFSAEAARADALPPGGAVVIPTDLPVPGTLIATETTPIALTSNPLITALAGSVLSAVYDNGPAGYVFAYQIAITSDKVLNSSNVFVPATVGFAAISGPWGGWTIGAFQDSRTGDVSVLLERRTGGAGDTIDITFNSPGIGAGKSSWVFWYQTNSKNYKNLVDGMTMQDGGTGEADVLVPSTVPEPSKLAAMTGFASMFGLGLVWQLRRRRKD
jgi:hypothetical protein